MWLLVLITVIFTIAYARALQRRVAKDESRLATSGSTVLLVTAHPDDEAMFFVPTIQACHKQSLKVVLLSLTSGDYDHIGHLRKPELAQACKLLGIEKHEIGKFDDSPIIKTWDDAGMAVLDAIKKHNASAVVTFDAHGVSGHVNHGQACLAARQASLAYNQENKTNILACWELESVSIWRKYIAFFDVFHLEIPPMDARVPNAILDVISMTPWLSWQAMRAHASQFVWYRRLFVVFSRYTYLNTLQRKEYGLVERPKKKKNKKKD